LTLVRDTLISVLKFVPLLTRFWTRLSIVDFASSLLRDVCRILYRRHLPRGGTRVPEALLRPTPQHFPLSNQATCSLLGRPIRLAIPFVYRPGPLTNRSTCYSTGRRGQTIPWLRLGRASQVCFENSPANRTLTTFSTRLIRKRYVVNCVACCAQPTGMHRISYRSTACSVGTSARPVVTTWFTYKAGPLLNQVAHCPTV
jgi:hypothetical protein